MFWQVVWNHLLHTSRVIAFESSSTRSSHSGQMASSWSEACAFDAVSFDLAMTVLVCFTGASDVLPLRDVADVVALRGGDICSIYTR